MVARVYGWRPDKPDFRDKVCGLRLKKGASKNVDLRLTGHMPPVYDQGQLGSCTGNAIGGAIEYSLRVQSKHDYVPSRLFIYYNERVIENTVSSDAGAEIRDGIQSVATTGACDESIWPYDISQFTNKPSDQAYNEAKKGIIKKYTRVPQKLANIQNVLSHGIPIVFGATLYNSFESDDVARTGIVPMPQQNENVVGGHAILMVGTNDTHFIVRNSWGPNWGEGGYCYFPHEYLLNPSLADDFWAIFLV